MTKTTEDAADLISIGRLARATGVSSRTIRYYEELGILPEPRRTPGGTRKYPSDYQAYIQTALALKDLGFRLDEIGPLARLALGRSVSAGQRDAAARLVDGRIEELARQVSVLHRLRESVRGQDAAGTSHGPASGQAPPGSPGAATAPVAGPNEIQPTRPERRSRSRR
jgi:DNA-binding transcriptional MerR regulator